MERGKRGKRGKRRNRGERGKRGKRGRARENERERVETETTALAVLATSEHARTTRKLVRASLCVTAAATDARRHDAMCHHHVSRYASGSPSTASALVEYVIAPVAPDE